MDESQSFVDLVESGAQGEGPPQFRRFKAVPTGQDPTVNIETEGEPHGLPASSSMGPYAHSDNFFDAQTTESHDVQDDIAEEAEVGRSPTTDVAVSLSDYNRVLFEARLQGVGDAELKFPWETGIMGQIFSDDDNVFPMASHFPFEYLGSERDDDADTGASASADVARSSVETRLDLPCYSFAVKVKPDLDLQELSNKLWISALEKWHQVFEVLNFPGILGSALEYECLYADVGDHGVVLRDALGIKSPRTAIKRAQTLLKYFSWLHGAFSDWDPWNRSRCLLYLSFTGETKAVASRGVTFLEALRFAKFVMQIPISNDLIGDAQLRGRAQRLMLTKTEYKPARALKVSEVALMERGMVADIDCIDKFLLGATLFCLYSRSRWSDIQHLDSIWIDRAIHNGEIFGFIETRTVFHKTATSLKKKRIFMPIVCPILGVTAVDWTSAWFAIWDSLGLDMDATPFGALCRAPNSDGKLCKRSCTSDEISSFLNRFLRTTTDTAVSSHSLKHTTLSWCSSYGMEEPLRTLLGHHELAGAKSMAVYSRDMLTRPLQAYCAMLANIRADHFRPDESRTSRLVDVMKLQEGKPQNSGDVDKVATLMTPELTQEPVEDYVEPATPIASPVGASAVDSQFEGSDSELASTSSESSGSSSEDPEDTRQADHIEGPVWRNRKSHVVHKCSEKRNQTQCGRFVSEPNFEYLENGCTTIDARCSRCFKGEVVSTVEGLADALGAARAKRLKT